MKRYEYKGFVINIKEDENPRDPRTEFDNITKMACWHSRYSLGDKSVNQDFPKKNYNTAEEMKADIIKREHPAIILPLYLYDHSGITISTSPFSCPWDSGQVGFVWITKEQAKRDLLIKYFTKKNLARVEECLKVDVRTYDDYLTGSVYGYEISKLEDETNILESVWGYYGYEPKEDDWWVLKDAKSRVDTMIEFPESIIPVAH